MQIHQVDVDIFYCVSENFDLLLAQGKGQGITKVIMIHPLGTMNDLKKYHNNLFTFDHFSREHLPEATVLYSTGTLNLASQFSPLELQTFVTQYSALSDNAQLSLVLNLNCK